MESNPNLSAKDNVIKHIFYLMHEILSSLSLISQGDTRRGQSMLYYQCKHKHSMTLHEYSLTLY